MFVLSGQCTMCSRTNACSGSRCIEESWHSRQPAELLTADQFSANIIMPPFRKIRVTTRVIHMHRDWACAIAWFTRRRGPRGQEFGPSACGTHGVVELIPLTLYVQAKIL